MPELGIAAKGPVGRPIRVLITTPIVNGRGGVTQYLNVLKPHLRNDVQYFTIGRRSDGENAAKTLFRMVHDSWQFARTLRRGNFDIVHLNPSIFPKSLLRDGILLLLAKALGKDVLIFAHGWNPAWDRTPPKYLQFMFRVVYSRSDAFIVLGDRFKRQARLLGYTKQIFVEGAPVADDLWDDGDNSPSLRFLADTNRFNILFLARVEKDKGIYEALHSYLILKQKYPAVTLTVAGDGRELKAARQYACTHQITDVSFIGHVECEEKRKAFQTANAYLFPSYHEGLPLSVLEAMAFGLPIVTCDVGGLPDFFENGAMGFITEDRDPEVLASLLGRLVSDPALCAKISLFNRNYARMHFTASQIATRIEQIYRVVLGVPDQALLPAG